MTAVETLQSGWAVVDSGYDATDLFCGAGGSGLGAAAAGVQLVMAANHSAMAFIPAYVIKGSKRQQVAQLGNAVTPCASEWLYRRCIEALACAA